MPITIIIRKTLDDIWGTDEEFATLTDADIIELLHEDLLSLLDGAKFEVSRTSRPKE